MFKFLIPTLAAVSLVFAGTANAKPNMNSIVNTTCTYPQVDAALTARHPAEAKKLHTSPIVQGLLQQFLAGTPEQRQGMVDSMKGNPKAQKYFSMVSDVAAVCNRY